MARPQLFERNVIVEKAMLLFWEHGFEATSLQDLTKHLGIGKSSFYNTFDSKSDLFIESLEMYFSMRLAQLKALLERDNSIQNLRSTVLLIMDELLADPKNKGCFMANTCSELGPRNSHIAGLIASFNTQLEHMVLKWLMENNIKTRIPAENFVKILGTYVLGMKQEIKFNHDRDAYVTSLDSIFSLA